jgi:thiol-disulfide isomerase/thioredoxin
MLPAIFALILIALVAAGCGGANEQETPTAAPTAEPAAANENESDAGREPGQADPVAANLATVNQLLDGGQETLDGKLSELRGHPVVVNQWASWCPPCRDELPFFNQSAKAHAATGDVAFLGLNYLDDRDAAESYLGEVPIAFPSISDPDGKLAAALGGGRANPSTMLLDRSGSVAFVHVGAYADRAALEAEIDEHLAPG